MAINSISPTQPTPQTQTIKQSELTASRKQSEIQDANRTNDRKDAAEQQAPVNSTQHQKAQEPVKPAVNTSGQKTGTLINTAA